MRLGIGVASPEKLASPLIGQVFDRVDVVAPGIKPVMRDSLGILVGQEVGHRALRRQRRKILTGDHLDVVPLVGQLLHDRPGDIGHYPGHTLQIGEVGQKAWGDGRGVVALQVGLDQGIRHESARVVKGVNEQRIKNRAIEIKSKIRIGKKSRSKIRIRARSCILTRYNDDVIVPAGANPAQGKPLGVA